MIPKVTVMKRYILRKGRQIERILTRTLIKKKINSIKLSDY